MKTAITTIILILLPFTLVAETPFSAYVEAVAPEHYEDWNADERFLFLLGFAAGTNASFSYSALQPDNRCFW